MNGKFHCVWLPGQIPHGTLHRRVSCKLHCNIIKGTYCSFFKDINLFKKIYRLYIIEGKKGHLFFLNSKVAFVLGKSCKLTL